MDVGSLISSSSAFSKPGLNIWKFSFHVLLKLSLEDFEHYFTSMWDECSCVVVWTFSGMAFLWDWNENWPLPGLWPLLSFPNLLAYWVQQFCSPPPVQCSEQFNTCISPLLSPNHTRSLFSLRSVRFSVLCCPLHSLRALSYFAEFAILAFQHSPSSQNDLLTEIELITSLSYLLINLTSVTFYRL